MKTAPIARSIQWPPLRKARRTGSRVKNTETIENQAIVATDIHAP